MILACSDSRVDPQTIFGAVPGEMFVLRNVAAHRAALSSRDSPGYHGTSAAIEFGVRVLKVSRLVVLGHAQCGGVRAMVYGAPPQARDFVASWVEIGKPALAAERADRPACPRSRRPWCGVSMNESDDLSLDRRGGGGGAACRCRAIMFDIHTGVLTRVTPDGVEPVE